MTNNLQKAVLTISHTCTLGSHYVKVHFFPLNVLWENMVWIWNVAFLSICRRNAISTGQQSAQPGTSTLWWIQWLSTTCLSTFWESSKSQMPGYVGFTFFVRENLPQDFPVCVCMCVYLEEGDEDWMALYANMTIQPKSILIWGFHTDADSHTKC